MKNKIIEIDFIKAFSALGIISFHYAYHIKSKQKYFYNSSRTTYGFLLYFFYNIWRITLL